MQMKSLRISLRKEYSKPGPDNPYQATLITGWDDNEMKVQLSTETCERILLLVADEIADAARVQIGDFVREAIAVSRTPQIEQEVI